MHSHLSSLTISTTQNIREALAAIDHAACEIALIVDDSNTLLGTLTDGDIRRALLSGADLDSRASDYMNKNFVAVGPETGRAEVLDLMRARSFQQIPVIDTSGRLIGLHLLKEIIGAQERPNWAVVMAGGKGMRLRPITEKIPKPMIEVAGRPILERIILHLVSYGIRKIFLSVNYMSEVITQHFEDGRHFGCEIDYIHENKPLGTAGSLSLLESAPSAPILVLNGDLLTNVDVGQLLRFHAGGGYSATVAVRHHSYQVPFGVVVAHEGSLQQLIEKPVERWLVNAGIYAISPKVLQRIPENEKFDMPQLLEECLGRKETVGVFETTHSWMDIGRPHELKKARGEDPTI